MQVSVATDSLQPDRYGVRLGIPGVQAVDHAGFVVPDLAGAVDFFTNVLGGAVLWRSAPFTGQGDEPKAPEGLNAAPGAAFRLAMLRLGPNLNVELIEYRVPRDQRKMPSSSDLGVGHLAFAVDDIKVAGAWLAAKGVHLLSKPRHTAEGPNAGQDSWFFLTPWGMAVELVERPAHMPYESNTPARLFTMPASTTSGAVDSSSQTLSPDAR